MVVARTQVLRAVQAHLTHHSFALDELSPNLSQQGGCNDYLVELESIFSARLIVEQKIDARIKSFVQATGRQQPGGHNSLCSLVGKVSVLNSDIPTARLHYKSTAHAFAIKKNTQESTHKSTRDTDSCTGHPSHALKIHCAFSDTQSILQEDRVQELRKATLFPFSAEFPRASTAAAIC